MATQQQVLFAETIAGMKKAFKRRAYESDSDSEVDNSGNRGQKLKKRARFARRGQLVPTADPSSYREIVEYGGVQRAILHRNPPLIDEEGFEIDSDDDQERVDEALAAAAELDPYADIRIEHILAPLTATTDLPTHPTLSKPFTSTTLTDLVDKSCAMTRKENHSLAQIRHLWTSLCGDYTWAPCETMLGPNDIELYTEDHVARHLLQLSKTSADYVVDSSKQTNGQASREEQQAEANAITNRTGQQDPDVSMGDDDSTLIAQEEQGERDAADVPMTNGEGTHDDSSKQAQANDADKPDERTRTALPDATQPPEPTPQVTADRHQQQQPDQSSFIHPLYAAPSHSRPDRNLGLVVEEADTLRRLLNLYITRQEEICRGAAKLHAGLLRAERLRNEVLRWSKAEAHRDMSDGEDWYDMEEWGLDTELKKGQDEEEENDTTTTGKKTRARR